MHLPQLRICWVFTAFFDSYKLVVVKKGEVIREFYGEDGIKTTDEGDKDGLIIGSQHSGILLVQAVYTAYTYYQTRKGIPLSSDEMKDIELQTGLCLIIICS